MAGEERRHLVVYVGWCKMATRRRRRRKKRKQWNVGKIIIAKKVYI